MKELEQALINFYKKLKEDRKEFEEDDEVLWDMFLDEVHDVISNLTIEE